jgi:hypothetical protein
VAAIGHPVADSLLRPAVGGVKAPSRSPSALRPASGSVVAAVGHPVAPAASRLLGPLVNLQDLARDQVTCQQTQDTVLSSSLVVRPLQQGAHTILCNVSRGAAWPLAPTSHRKGVFEALHNISQPGIIVSKHLISSRFVWKGMAKGVTAWCRDCQDCARGKNCARGKVTTHARAAVPGQRFSHIHMDLVGPLPMTWCGHTNLFTVVDRSTCWAEAVPVSSTTASIWVQALFTGWIA